jgi:hypothetical protein
MSMISKRPETRNRTAIALALGAVALLPRCACDEGEGIQRAAVAMKLTLVETDPCSGIEVPRDIPDDYERVGLALSTDFGSRAERVFEVRSVGTAPLTLKSVALSAEDEEFSLAVTDGDGGELSLPLQIAANAADQRPAVLIKVSYAAVDAEPDGVKLLVETDDAKRSSVAFDLVAGKGRLEVCGPDGCSDMVALQFGNVTRGTSATQQLVLRNSGEGDLDLRSIALSSDSAEFCAPEATSNPDGVEDCAPINLCRVLKPNETYTVNLRYSPIDGGLDEGLITIVSGDASRGNVTVPINGTGAGPALCACVVDMAGTCVPAATVDFGFVDVGATEARTVRLTSCGTEPVPLNEAVLETDAGSFYETDPEFTITTPFMTGLLMPGSSAEGVITYAPTRGGENRGGLRYVVTQQNLRSWLALVGRAATCDLSALPAQVSYGTVAGGQSSDRTVSLINDGAKDCVVSSITDPTDPAFSIVMKPNLPLTIAPGASHDLTVRYTVPQRQTPSGDMATFEVVSDEPAPDATNVVTLLGQGGGTPVCVLNVQPTSGTPVGGRDGTLNFGAVNIGYMQTQPIRIANVGNANCVLQSFNLTKQSAAEFSATTSMPTPVTIAPQTTATIDVTFAPTSGAGGVFPWYGGLLNYVDFSVQGPGLTKTDWSIGLRARPTVPTIDVIPSEIDFGLVTWDRPQAPDNRSSCGSETRVVRIYNSGNGALRVMSIAIDASSDHLFNIIGVTMGGQPLSAPYATTIQPGANAEVQLRFFPTRISPSQHTGLLVIDNDVTGQSTVPLRGEGTPNAAQTDVFQQLSDNKVDILWVVDDSGSMSEEQRSLATNIQWFTQYATQLNADWQMGVITSEVNDPVSGVIWGCQGFNPIIRHTDANAVQAFQCAANVTNPPNGNRRPNPMGSDEQEAGLQAARIALDPPVRDMQNAGFMRPDARLAVIIVSDEEDQSQGPVSLYVDFFRQLKGFRNPQLVSVSAIAGDVPNGCATAAAGSRYNDAARQLGGQFDSICNSDWTRMLQNIGLDVFALRTAWTLSRPADPASIVVRVDGRTVPNDPTNGFSYEAPSNSISFHGSAVPNTGARVEVQYNARCIP